MAAGKEQGKSLSVFLIGLVTACAGGAAFASASGKLALVVGIVLVAVSLWAFLQLKPLEGKIALNPQPAGLKLLGVCLAVGGWLVVLCGLHLTQGVGGRMAAAIVGILVSLAGVLFVLPTASNKNAIWKA